MRLTEEAQLIHPEDNTIQVYGPRITVQYAAVMVLIAAPLTGFAASLVGVKDVSGMPLEDARIDHIGRVVVVTSTDLHIKPSPDEIRTDSEGHFRVVTNVPAIVTEHLAIRASGSA